MLAESLVNLIPSSMQSFATRSRRRHPPTPKSSDGLVFIRVRCECQQYHWLADVNLPIPFKVRDGSDTVRMPCTNKRILDYEIQCDVCPSCDRILSSSPALSSHDFPRKASLFLPTRSGKSDRMGLRPVSFFIHPSASLWHHSIGHFTELTWIYVYIGSMIVLVFLLLLFTRDLVFGRFWGKI